MNLITPERRSNSHLFAFIDLLFLLVAFFVLLLFVEQTKKKDQTEVEALQQQLHSVLQPLVGEQDNVKETLQEAIPMLSELIQENNEQRQRAKKREEVRQTRKVKKLEYRITQDGRILYQNRYYTPKNFHQNVLQPLRKEHWIALRAYVTPSTPFDTVIRNRNLMLQGRTQFDSYWDNLVR